MYMVSQEQLDYAISKRAWKHDVNQSWGEFNVHFHYYWLVYYWLQLIPLSALRHSVVHHTIDKYIPPQVSALQVWLRLVVPCLYC